MLLLIALASCVNNCSGHDGDARKLLVATQRVSSLEPYLLKAALPKGPFLSSSTNLKGHGDEKHIIRHFAGVVDRILNANPSPGVGH